MTLLIFCLCFAIFMPPLQYIHLWISCLQLFSISLYILYAFMSFCACPFSHTLLHRSIFFLSPFVFPPSMEMKPFFHFPSLQSLYCLSQGLSQCHMTNGTTTSRPGCVMQWLSLLQRPPPWFWTGGHTPCWSQVALGHPTKRAPTLAIPRKS